ncbi:ABC transporter ATP-binding protein [Phaeobacter sp.]|uniref:ABC transporter ATP-binding protein n=1 Tax=Phaeobacter sp. TaxID=1902409 RepID=UPI0025E9DD9C|nr:ABC transporter ATP-binding protein [Phaeobacter sp.]
MSATSPSEQPAHTPPAENLSIQNLSVSLRGRDVFRDVSFDIQPGEFVGLLGPNGAGKTTLMRAALGLIAAKGNSSLAALTAADRAHAVAWMPQAREIAWPIAVERLVALGRLPHLPQGARLTPQDQAKVDQAIDQMGLQPMRHRAASRLSGGEQARVLIARALAQDTPLLMADEPAAGLDPAHQIATMEIFARLAQEGRSAFVSLHDLGLAARHCTRLILMGDHGVLADGPPDTVLTPDLMAQAFGISVWHQQTAQGPVFQPLEVL